MGRKTSKGKTTTHAKTTGSYHPVSEESEYLLGNDDGQTMIKKTSTGERKISTMAPPASETDFGDVPVLTICPYCEKKVVTKTHFSKKKSVL